MPARKKIEYIVTEAGCHECTSHRVDPSTGYIKVNRDGKQTHLHKYIWERLRGPVPEGMIVMHICNNKRCIRPDHIAVGTHGQNIQDAYDDGLKTGPRNLSPDQIRAIRSSRRSSHKEGEIHGVHPSNIRKIRQRVIYKEIR